MSESTINGKKYTGWKAEFIILGVICLVGSPFFFLGFILGYIL